MMVGWTCRKFMFYVHRQIYVFLASYGPFCYLVFFPSSFPQFSLSFFTSFLLPLGVRRASLRDSFCIWERCITCDVRTRWVSITLGLSGLQAYLMARTLTLPRPPTQRRIMTMMWRVCVFNLPRVNKTEPLYFWSLLLCLGDHTTATAQSCILSISTFTQMANESDLTLFKWFFCTVHCNIIV